MGARGDGVKKDPAAAAAAPAFQAVDGDLSGAFPVGQAGVDFDGQGSVRPGDGDLRPQNLFGLGAGVTGFASPGLGGARRSTVLGGGDLRPQDLSFDAPAPPGGGLGNAFDVPVPGLGRGAGGGLGSPDGRLTRPLLGAQHVGCAGPAPAGRRGDPHGPERDPLGAIAREMQVPGDFRSAAGGDRGGMTRHLALLFLLLGAVTLAGKPDAPWLSQLGALLAWLAGCILLFLSLLAGRARSGSLLPAVLRPPTCQEFDSDGDPSRTVP
ncbi:hypothetical protein GQ55_1G288300 [Panicum hallii var. hallii]|uniref:Uncharacterized protein n=1 Tax=Panicum hallii var. hallii TaxID=1504633 RepID=A0A2T7F8J8_9POAL|nr:hypothetical protein GQ55_1G288300 [Panicum hallii var. hallii]